MLTDGERAFLLRAWREHPVAKCGQCSSSFRTTELAADRIGGLDSVCPSCRGNLTESIREHLIACGGAASWDAQNVCAEATTLRETASWLRKEARRLREAASVVRVEAEAATRRARDARHDPPSKQAGQPATQFVKS